MGFFHREHQPFLSVAADFKFGTSRGEGLPAADTDGLTLLTSVAAKVTPVHQASVPRG